MIDYKPFLDEKNYPICSSPNPDGGDCAADLGTIMALTNEIVPELPWDYITSQPLRYWNPTMWAGSPHRFSRDQLIAVLCGFISRPDRDEIVEFYEAHKKRWFLTAWNTLENDGSEKSFPASLGDICGPEVWALWIRLYKPWWSALILWFLDIQTLIGAIQWRFTAEDNQITRNHMLVCIASKISKPSITSIIANAINDWDDLINRWKLSNIATQEYPTWDLFDNSINKK